MASYYLKRWGFSPQVPTKQAYQRDPEKVDRWLNVDFPQIREEAKKADAEILFANETGIKTESFKNRSYSPIGVTPVIPTTGSRFSLNVISAVAKSGIMRFMTYSTTLTSIIFIQFLAQLVQGFDGQMVYLVVDNLKVHHSKIVTRWLENHSDLIKVFYLPAYCPDLNPNEYLNHLMKQEFHSKPQPKDKQELAGIMRKVLRGLQRSPQKLQNLFKKPEIHYAA
jgi:transposase